MFAQLHVDTIAVWGLLSLLVLTLGQAAYRPADVVTEFRQQVGLRLHESRRAFGQPSDQRRSRISAKRRLTRMLGESGRHEKDSPVVSIQLPGCLVSQGRKRNYRCVRIWVT